ncbi:zinc finger protein 107-like [Phlebotomus papatasi]|uniref:zinc finger protein 107-like n=1 Tax=Phlebotomus papatasi TaxID=29031 RepID=UPI00248344B5|nr:zinc finger protein 107-like [Phlebotomus papatasi]
MAGIQRHIVQGEDLLLSQSALGENIEEVVVTTHDTAEKDSLAMEKSAPLRYSVQIVQKNGIETQVWVCGVCNREFKYQYAFLRHFPTHAEGTKSFQCDYCLKTFRQVSTLHQHKATHSQERPFICDICSKSFNRISTLISHKKTHSDIKPFKCPICGHGFHQKGNLRNHVYIHTNERPYKCPIPNCSKGFNQMSNLACHKLKAHSQEEGISFQCKPCNLRFAKKAQLKLHLQQFHREEPPKGNAKSKSKYGPITAKSTTISKIFPFEKAIAIPFVDTLAMRRAKAKEIVPFGLLNTQANVSLLVRIYDFGTKSIIREATAEDLSNTNTIPIVAIITEKDGEYSVKMPLQNFAYELNNTNGKYCFVKKEIEEKDDVSRGRNAFLGTIGLKEEDEGFVNNVGSHFGGFTANNSFCSLMEAIKSEGLSTDVPNMMKFFAESPESPKETSQWEKIDKDSMDEQKDIQEL